MQDQYVNAPHIVQLVAENKVRVLGTDVARAAERHLSGKFLLQTRATTTIIDWDRTPSVRLAWNLASDDESATWAATTLAGKASAGLLLFNRDQPCLVGPFDFMIRNLDELVCAAYGSRVLFGVEQDSTGAIEFTNGIIEYDGRATLYATVDG